MKIKYLGHSAFYISCGQFTACIDPFDGIGYPLERRRAEYALSTHSHFDHNALSLIEFDKKVSSEKQAEGTPFRAVRLFHDEVCGRLRGENLAYVFKADGLTVCHLGDAGEKFSSDIKKKIGKIDVLLVPVGGNYTIDALEAKKYVDGLSPKIVIPMHYKTARSNIDIDGKDEFLSLFSRVLKVPAEIELCHADSENDFAVLDLNDDAF